MLSLSFQHMMNGVSFLYLYNLYNTYGRQPESNASAREIKKPVNMQATPARMSVFLCRFNTRDDQTDSPKATI